MANTVKLKRSAVGAKVPTTSDLDLGELAINTYDGKVYLKRDNGTASVVEVGAVSFQPLDADLTSIAGLSGTSGLLKKTAADTWSLDTSTYLTAAVTSVGATSPVASSGGNTPTISLADGYGDTKNPYASKTQKYVLAAPNGADGAPTFRALLASDIPTLNQNTSGSAASLSVSGQTGLLTVTGLTSTNRVKTVRDAADTVLELGGSYTPSGTWVWTSATVTWPTFNQDTTGSAVYWKTSGTGKAALSGPAVGATRTYTFPDADTTVLTTNAAVTVAQGGTGVATLTGIVKASGTSAFSAATAGTDYAKPDTASSWSGTQTFNNSAIRQLGSSTGYTTLTSSNAGASNYTYYLPASNTYAWISSYHHTLSGPTAARTFTFPDANATVLTTNAAVTVSQGGTGATTLTGILVGNGTSAFSAAVSGTDIKTVNGTSLLGSGDVAISGSSMIFTGFDGGTASTSTFDLTLDLGGA